MITIPDGGAIWMDVFVDQVRQHIGEDALTNAVIYDIGTLDGRDAASLKQLLPGSVAYAFEGSERNFQLLQQNTEVVGFQQILSDTTKQVEYHEKEDRGISGLLNRGSDRPGYIRTAEAMSLDEFMEQKQLPAPTLMKLDVEGAAFEVLSGATKALATVRGLHLETENYPYFEGQKLESTVFKLLREQGLECVLIHRNFVDANGHQSDSVWVRR